jgi:hypothetical protein
MSQAPNPPQPIDHPLYDAEAAARGDPYPFMTAETGPVDPDVHPLALAFEAVPRRRNRRNGWTEETQRLFILALSDCGCVRAAARAVGMSTRSAYRLLDADGADSFAAAWDQAIARGIERLREVAFARAFEGAWVPVVRRGQLVRFEHRFNDRLAIALLSGRDASVATNRERAMSRRKYRQRMKELAERKTEKARAEAAFAAEYQAELDAIPEKLAERARRRTPRIARL